MLLEKDSPVCQWNLFAHFLKMTILLLGSRSVNNGLRLIEASSVEIYEISASYFLTPIGTIGHLHTDTNWRHWRILG